MMQGVSVDQNIKKNQCWFGRVFAPLLLVFGFSVQAAVLNEWNFYSDPAGRTLSQATNSAGNISFSPGNEAGLATDGLGDLLCTQDDAGSTTGIWTNGAILDATLSSPVNSGVKYLRYDLSYDLSSTNNNSGCLVGFSFYDGTGNQVAGVMLGCDVGTKTTPDYSLTPLEEMDLAGTIAVIAKINLSNQTLSVWYDLTGDVSGFLESSPATNKTISLSSFNSLRFQATGDIKPAGSTNNMAVDLLRTADSWEDILLGDPGSPPALQIQVSNQGMDIGGTNTVPVIIRNAGGIASDVTSGISYSGPVGAFTIASNNTTKTLWPGDVMTNSYTLVANTNGSYLFTARAFLAGTNNTSTNFNVVVGSQISYLTNSIAEVSEARGQDAFFIILQRRIGPPFFLRFYYAS
jgi:hypothetical protein